MSDGKMKPRILTERGFSNGSSALQVFTENATDGGLKRILLRGKFQEADAENVNGRIYPFRVLDEKIVKGRCSPENLLAMPLFMEIIHPMDDNLTIEINGDKIAGKVNWLRWEGTALMGEAEIIPETPSGWILYKLVEKYGAVPGVSSRALGSLVGQTVSFDTYRFITFDFTFSPSTYGAFLKDKVFENEEFSSYIKRLDESAFSVLNETFNIQGESSNIQPNSSFTTMSTENSELLKKVSTLSESVGDYKSRVTILEAELKEARKKLKEMEDEEDEKDKELADAKKDKEEAVNESAKIKGYYEKSLKVIEGMRARYNDLSTKFNESQTALKEASKVKDGLTAEVTALKENYGKSLKVLEAIREKRKANSLTESIVNKVGKENYEKFQTVFAKCNTLAEAEDVFSKLTAVTPTRSRLTLRENAGQGSGKKDITRLDESSERRVSLYDLD